MNGIRVKLDYHMKNQIMHCIDSVGRLHIVGGSAGDDPIRRIDLNKISFNEKDNMYIDDPWEIIYEYTDYKMPSITFKWSIIH